MRQFLPVFLALLAGCTLQYSTPETGLFAGDPWPDIRTQRIETLLPRAMDGAGVDAWITLCRENNNDPMAHHIGCENAGGLAAFLFFRTQQGVYSVAISPVGEATALAEKAIMSEVIPMSGRGLWSEIGAQFERFRPDSIAINSGRSAIADGLSHRQHTRMMQELGGEWTRRMVSSEPLILSWLSVKLPDEVAIMREAARLTARWQVEAYAAAIPGVTTDRDIADMLEAKMAAAGVGDAWAPEQNPSINSGKDRGHSHPTERVIQPGDFIQTDFGIRVHDRWVTDIQRFAYVLAPDETAPPPDALQKWEAARAGSRAAYAAMEPGATGADVDRAQRISMRKAGSLPVRWSTGHPVGYWAHDSGPALSGGREGAVPSGRQTQPLEPGMTFAFDGFHSWGLTDSTTKTISVEEMVVITETGAEWMTPPQEELILIPSRR